MGVSVYIMPAMKKYLAGAITVLVLAVFAWYALTHQNIFTALGRVSIWLVLAIAALRLVRWFFNGLFTKITAEAFTDKFTVRESFMIAIITAVGNFFGPLFGGLGLRALYLKKYHNLSVSKFTSTLIGYYLLVFMANSLLAVASLLALTHTSQTGYLIAIFSIWFVVFFGLAFVRLPQSSRLGFLTKNRVGKLVVKLLYEIEDGWRLLLSNKILMLKTASLAVVTLAVTFFMIYLEFRALGIHAGAAAVGLYTALTQVAILLSFTPDNVGFREAILLLLATTIGVSHAQIVQVSVIDRGIQFTLLLIMLPIAANLRRQIKLSRASTN